MAIELDPQSLREYATAAIAWVKKNNLLAGLLGAGIFAVVLFTFLILSLVHGSGGTKTESLSVADANLCQRLQKLEALASHHQTSGHDYQRALKQIFTELSHDTPSPDDLAVLSTHQSDCQGLSNDDFAWLLELDTRIRRGVWPAYPENPPTASELRQKLTAALDKNSNLAVEVGADPTIRGRWLLLAAETATPPSALLKTLLPERLSPTDTVAAYNEIARTHPRAPFLPTLYGRLGLLTHPIYVLDTHPLAGPAAVAGGVPTQVWRGPENTLRFLGVLTGEVCAVGITADELPPLWVRPCLGLVPRSLPDGELFLIGGEVKLGHDVDSYFLPVLLDQQGQLTFADHLPEQVSDKLLTAFVAAAPAFTFPPKVSIKGLVPFVGQLTTIESPSGQRRLLFKTSAAHAKTDFVGFASNVTVKTEHVCPKIEKAACDRLRNDSDDRCEMGPTTCVSLPLGSNIRWAIAHHIKPVPCLKDFGMKQSCGQTDSFYFLIETKSASAAFSAAEPIPVLVRKPSADDL